MKKSVLTHVFLLFFPLLFLAACAGNGADLPAGVDEVFGPFYEQMGGARIFGQPITEAFLLEAEGLMVQYFQNLRLEYAVGQPQSVRISPLGTWGYEGLREILLDDVVLGNGRSRLFAESNQIVRDEFLTFYEAFAGEQLLGLPISAQLVVGGVRTQYFENGRLEWRPQLPLEQRVQLGWLGREHFDGEMAFTYRAFANAAPATSSAEVAIMAAVDSPVAYVGEQQQLFVTLLGMNGEQLSGMAVTAVLHHDGTATELQLGETNGQGKLVYELDLTAVSPGQDVVVKIVVWENGREVGQTHLTFRTWW